MSDMVLVILVLVIVIVAAFVLPQLFTKQAIPSVIRIFRKHDALGISGSKTADKLGIKPQTMTQRMFKRSDYKPRALQLLISANIIQMTEDGKLYLSEENLVGTKWEGC